MVVLIPKQLEILILRIIGHIQIGDLLLLKVACERPFQALVEV